MHRILFHIGSYPIFSFGVFVALGCVAASYLAASQSGRLRLDRDNVLEICVWVVAAAVLGARLGFVLQNAGFYATHPGEILNMRAGGMSWHGSLVGIVVGAYIPCRRHGVALLDFLDIAGPGILLGLAVGRIGCFLNGCCYGKVTEAAWAIVTPTESDPVHLLPRYPTQLLEMGLALVTVPALVLWLRHRRFKGEVFIGFLVLYSVIRFVVEFFREGATLGGTPLTLAQWVSVGLVGVGGAAIALRRAGQPASTLEEAESSVGS
ncbi:MAG: prolipoprotein diacylglyceryl transferase [Proteobacteria bacterium]|nr:prolipoprotein diacylglyceryl transferase [Pseudomonadota bacterium]